MVFSSLLFLCAFLPVVLLIYYLVPGMTAKNMVLTVFSLLFYAFGEPLWLILLIFSALIHYAGGRLIEKYAGTPRAKLCFILSLVLSIGFLCVFKYLNFFIRTLDLLPGVSVRETGIALPLGISFYTFQVLSYSIDVYRGKVKAEHSFLEFLLFVSAFPQLITGPILRYPDMDAQLHCRKTTWQGALSGVTRFACGLGKKVLIADYCSKVVLDRLGGTLTFAGSWLGLLMYAFQLYFDFSGYSDMAIGLGRLFGFEYAENFDHPYISRSITEFWRRWHITLGAWFRDYIYFPLGGSRKGLPRQLLNMLVVWLLTGLWHGAGWNFVLWGLWFFVLLVAEKCIGLKRLEKIPGLIAIPVTFFLVLLGRVFFYFEDVSSMLDMFRALFGRSGLYDTAAKLQLVNSLPLLAVCFIGATPLPLRLAQRWKRRTLDAGSCVGLYSASVFLYNALILALCLISLAGATNSPFIYFRF